MTEDHPLERIILDQHTCNSIEMVPLAEIRKVLDGDQPGNFLLMLDGLDEYAIGTNRQIDECLLTREYNGNVVVSVRSYHKNIEQINGLGYDEIQLCGLGSTAVEQCVIEKIGHLEAVSEIRSRRDEMIEWWRVPILLMMACILYMIEERIPASRIELIKSFIEMCLSHVMLLRTGQILKKCELNEMMSNLGNRFWAALSKGNGQSTQIELGQGCSEVKNEGDGPIHFHHKLLQEYLAAKFLVNQQDVMIFETIPTWSEIKQNQNMLRSLIGIIGTQLVGIETNAIGQTCLEWNKQATQRVENGQSILGSSSTHYDNLNILQSFQDESLTSFLTNVIQHICQEWNRQATQRLENGKFIFGSSSTQNDDLWILQSFQDESPTAFNTEDLCIYPTKCNVSAESLFLSDLLIITKLCDRNSEFDCTIFSHFEKAIIDLRNSTVHWDNIENMIDICSQNLVAFSLNGCSVTSFPVMPCFELVTNLTHLSILNCSIEKSDLEIVSLQLSQNSQLKFIEICNNSVSLDGIKFSDSMSKADTPSALKHLNLTANSFPVHVSKIVLSWITSCSYLRILHLARNVLSGQLERLISAPPPTLEKLFLCSTHLTSRDVTSIADAIKDHKLPALQRLDMTHNNLHDSHAAPLIEELSRHLPTKLTLCIRAGNHLSGQLLGYW